MSNPDHICHHEEDIGTIKEKLNRVHREMFGNGGGSTSGLSSRFIRIETEHSTVMEALEKLATSFSALTQTLDTISAERTREQVERDALDKAKAEAKKARSGMIKTIATVVGIVGGILGMLFMILEHV